ncbi:MAG TPA: OmpA family protein, partial [Polyangiaceae bacterium]|nr:OmpA family protein [Polyangiaceae bacterium]
LVRNNPDARIQVEGHTDNQGQASRNDELSKQRAESVATYLKSRGIAADRVSAVGRGSSKPVADNTSVEGRALNRRVEIVVEPPKESK